MLLLLPVTASFADEKNIFGLPFGRTLDRSITQCINRTSTGNDYCSLRKEIDRMAPPLGEIVMAPNATDKFNLPSWMITNNQMFISFSREGELVGIEADTVGPEQQDRVIASIKERFGSPVSKIDNEVQNAYGAKWVVSTAHWANAEVVIRFGCIDRLTCRVKFKSPKLDALERAASNQRKDKL